MAQVEVAVIGGSGLYGMSALTDVEEMTIETPFGPPSDAIIVGTLHGRRVAFLPRHGRGHVHTPTTIPYHANIYALKTLGVRYVIAVSACGSLRERFEPGHVVIPDQLFDFTRLRSSSFFGADLVAHVSAGDPFSAEFSTILHDAVAHVGGTVHKGATFITIEGPRFSTRGESHTFRRWGMDIIGMTTSPEAYLALEAEMAYACMAHITDYDVWHETEDDVTVEMVVRTLLKNTALAQAAIAQIVQTMDSWAGEFAAHTALKDAIFTDPQRISAEARDRVGVIADRYLPT